MIVYCKDCQEKHKLPTSINIIFDYRKCEICKKPSTGCFFYGGACYIKKVNLKYDIILTSLLKSLLRSFKKHKVDFNGCLSKLLKEKM